MMSRILAADLPAHVGEHIMIAGWLHRRRELKSVTFLIVRDRSGLAQVVLAAREEILPDETALPEETVIQVTGTVVANVQLIPARGQFKDG
jgi:nondiscriminating aspartyl-tRNA synthetase